MSVWFLCVDKQLSDLSSVQIKLPGFSVEEGNGDDRLFLLTVSSIPAKLICAIHHVLRVFAFKIKQKNVSGESPKIQTGCELKKELLFMLMEYYAVVTSAP